MYKIQFPTIFTSAKTLEYIDIL